MLSRKRSVASTATRCRPSWSPSSPYFCELILRRTPLFTNTQVSREDPVAASHDPQGGRNRRIDTAREETDSAPLAYGLAHAGDSDINEMLCGPGGFAPTNVRGRSYANIGTRIGCGAHSGWNCTPTFFARGLDRGHRARGTRHRWKRRAVPLLRRHGDIQTESFAGIFCSFEKTRAILDFNVGMTVLALVGGRTLHRERAPINWSPVTDTEDGQT